jgi:hypothetical protein
MIRTFAAIAINDVRYGNDIAWESYHHVFPQRLKLYTAHKVGTLENERRSYLFKANCAVAISVLLKQVTGGHRRKDHEEAYEDAHEIVHCASREPQAWK